MNRPTEKDIQRTLMGFYVLPCDGRHDYSFHRYLYYTKREVITLWRSEHPINKEGQAK